MLCVTPPWTTEIAIGRLVMESGLENVPFDRKTFFQVVT